MFEKIKNLFGRKPERIGDRKNASGVSLRQIAEQFSTFERLQRTGVMFYNKKQKRVYISLNLATIYLHDENRWNGFLGNLQAWIQYNKSAEFWNRYFTDEENKAVREAKKKYACLSSADINHIKQEARLAVDPSSVERPNPEPYDFAITRGYVFDEDNAIIVVGHYEDGSFSMMPYDDVFLQATTAAVHEKAKE